MRRAGFIALLSLLAVTSVAAAEDIGSVGYRFRYISRARTGGFKGAVGLAEDPPYASISCHQVGPVDVDKAEKVKSPHEVFSERASLIFKTTQVVRFFDGFEILDPGVVWMASWRPDPGTRPAGRPNSLYGGVGRKPAP